MERLIAFLVCDKINPMKGVRNIVADRTVSALNQPEHLIMIQHCRRRLAGKPIGGRGGRRTDKCSGCGKPAYKSTAAEAIEPGFGLPVVRNIPCYQCNECDETFYTGDAVLKLEAMISEAKQMMQDFCIADDSQAA